MKKDFFRHSFLYGISGFLTRGISILLIPLYTRIFSPDDYGIIDWLSILTYILNIVLPLQVYQAFARFFPDYKGERIRQILSSTALWFSLSTRLLPLLVTLIAPTFFANLIFDQPGRENLVILWSVSVLVTGFGEANGNLMKWTLRPERRLQTSLANSVGTLSMVFLFVVGLDMKLEGVFLGRIVGCLPAMALGYHFNKSYFVIGFSRRLLKKMLRYSYPLVFSSISIVFMTYVDRVFIKYYLNFDELGLYGVGYRFSSIVAVLFTGISHAITPLIYNNYREKETPRQLADLFRYCLALGGLFALGLTFFSEEAILILATPEYLKGAKYIPFLVIANVITYLYVFFPGLELQKRTDLVAMVFVMSGLVNLGLNYILIQAYGAIGVALGTSLASVFSLVLRYAFSQKYFKMIFNWVPLSLWLIWCAILILLYEYVLIDMTGLVAWSIKAGLLLLSVVYAIAVGMVRLSEFKSIKKLLIKK